MENKEESQTQIIAWAKHRKNYVSPVSSILWRLKDAGKFGRLFRGNVEPSGGELFKSDWNSLLKLMPVSMEIVQNPNPFKDFVEKLRSEDEIVVDNFLQDLIYLSVIDCTVDVEDLCHILNSAYNLEVFESADLIFSDFEKILTTLRAKTRLKAITFQCPLTVDQFREIGEALRFQLKIARFCGSPGMEYSEFMKIRELEFPCVELLALQNFNYKIIDDENVELMAPMIFFNKIYFVFPNLKMLFFDWSIIDEVCSFDDRAKIACEQMQRLFVKLKLQFVAILIYCPSEEMKMAVKQIREFFEEKNGGSEKLKVHALDFSILNDGPPNFSLIIFGEYHYQARTKRMIEVIYENKETKPDLRHFCYVVDNERLLWPDVTVDFGGFDSDDVTSRYQQGPSDEYLNGEAIVDRCFSGSSG